MPDERERGGITMGSGNRGGADRIKEKEKIYGWMDRAEERRKARKQRRVWGLRAREGRERRI
jgi:predicted secreted protein